MYRLLTGQTPPDADVINDEGFPSNPGYVSGKVWKAMEAAMQPRRKDRPQSIAEFLAMFDGAANVWDDDRTDFDSHCGEDGTSFDDDKAKSAQAGGTRNRKPALAPKPSWLRWAVPAVACLLMAAGVFFFLRPEPVPTTGTLTVVSEPSGASVYADIRDSLLTLIGTTPLAVEISRGPHGIVVRKDGYEPYTTDVTIADAAVAVNVTLTAKPVEPARPATTRFYVTTAPSGAAVTIDGKSIGKTPIKGSDVTKGSHSVKITKDGYETYTAKLSFGDDPVVVNETLKEKPVQTSSSASQSSPSAAQTRPTTGTHNGHDWVDLGLSVKWATCNVGASSPSDYGNYYAWGEVRTKSEYTEDNCATWNKSMGDISGNSTYDAARYNWGGKWRLPTKAECQELVDNCTWTWTTQGGHKGCKVTSNKNGASIFLPAAGARHGSSLDQAGESGCYWSSTPFESITQDAYDLSFYSGDRYVAWDYRRRGRSVRPVSE